MLQKAFFKVNVVDRIYETPVFEKTTPGAYEFTVPEEYNYVVIEYAGAKGGDAPVGSNVSSGGKGSIIKTNKIKIQNRNILGIIGAVGEQGGHLFNHSQPSQGGVGHNNGGNGTAVDGKLGFYYVSGAGGGSTSVVINNTTLEASAGSGAVPTGSKNSGKGGGVYGGAIRTNEGAGNDATDPNRIGLNSGNGYVKIWAGYDPYFKG